MTRSDQERVADVLGGVGRLQEVRDGGRAAFDREWIVRSAACYELLVIGEALNALSDEFMLGHVGLPVRTAKDLRNVLAHEYFRTRRRYSVEYHPHRYTGYRRHVASSPPQIQSWR